MDGAPFIPKNDLETLLTEVMQGKAEVEDFVSRLLAGEQIFMPVQDEKHTIAGFQISTKAQPLVIEDDEGTRIMVLFTSPERAKPFTALYPDYTGGLLAEFSWILRRIGGGFPIAINPGWDVGIDFDAETIAQLAASLPEDTPN